LQYNTKIRRDRMEIVSKTFTIPKPKEVEKGVLMEINNCSKCVSCEAIEYTEPYHVDYECRQADILLNDLQRAEGCQCFEKADDMSLGGTWKLDGFWRNKGADSNE
jgi:hypothetical protein